MMRWALFTAMAAASSGCTCFVASGGAAFSADPAEPGYVIGVGVDDYLDPGLLGFSFEMLSADLEDGGGVSQSRVLSRIGCEAHSSRENSLAFDGILGLSFNDLDGADGAAIDDTTVLIGAGITYASAFGRGHSRVFFVELRYIYVPWDLDYGGEEDDYSGVEVMVGVAFPFVE